MVQKAKRNKSFMYVGAVRLSEINPINFGEIRPRENKPRSTCVWVQKVKGQESYMYVGAARMRETSPNKVWRN